MAKPLSFKDFTDINPDMTDDEWAAYQDQKRKNGAYDEALDMKQRRQRAIAMRRNKSKIRMGRKRAERRVASMDKLKKRARRQARNTILQKLLKDVPKSELSNARKKEIEKRLEKPMFQKRMDRMSKKILPQVRKQELQRKRGGKSAD